MKKNTILLGVLGACVLVGCSPAKRDMFCSGPSDCPKDQVCKDSICVDCQPTCTGKCCGSDDCGGICPDICGATQQTCNEKTCSCEGNCVPTCNGKVCGPDGCNKTCPPGCSTSEICESGTCKKSGCTSDENCKAPTPKCDKGKGACVQCLDAEDCADKQICSGGVCANQPTCTADAQCEIGQICDAGLCVTGCRSTRDCANAWTCLPTLGAHGTCVQCENDPACKPGFRCQDYRCVSYCTEDSHCAPRFCNSTTHQCVDCREDAQCDTGKHLICLGASCVEGCRKDSDCAGGRCDTATDAFKCVQCFTTDQCPLGNLCVDKKCVPGCKSDRDCSQGLRCDTASAPNGACVECLLDAHCKAGYRCRAGLCSFFCKQSTECAAPTPVCDTANGTCVVCLANDQCQKGTICVQQACVPGCVSDRDCPQGLVCAPSLGTHGSCVVCLENRQCPPGSVCDKNHCILSGSDMIRIPAGDFVRGSDPDEGEADERPEKVISLPTYYIDRTEVTNAQYKACVDAGTCSAPSTTTDYANPTKATYPVVFVTRAQASTFCGWLGKSLPTEARWERAARGPNPDERTYPWGDTTPNCSRANYLGCNSATASAGSLPSGASLEGALDMAGNVSEWVSDNYSATYYTDSTVKEDPSGSGSGDTNVVRGGAFDSPAENLRSANRAALAPDSSAKNLGFRCVLRGIPVPKFTVTPTAGPYAETTFAVDASGTLDANHPVDVLETRWDWEDDDTYDTTWTTAKTASHRYSMNGIFTIRLEVRDPDANTATISTKVVAVGPNGWDGVACTTDKACANGFVCALQFLSTQGFCREKCIVLIDPTCHLADRECKLFMGADNSIGMACVPTK